METRSKLAFLQKLTNLHHFIYLLCFYLTIFILFHEVSYFHIFAHLMKVWNWTSHINHFLAMLHIYTSWKHQKNLRFSDIGWKYKNVTLRKDGKQNDSRRDHVPAWGKIDRTCIKSNNKSIWWATEELVLETRAEPAVFSL